MKNPHFISWQPMFHWTDQKIHVHAFYSVLALTLTSLLHKILHQAGLDVSTHEALEQLSDIREVLVIHGRGKKNPSVTPVLSDMNDLQKRLYSLLKLDQYLLPRTLAP